MNEQEQMNFFHEIFDASLPRLGPGDEASTRKALDIVLASRKDGTGEPRSATRLKILDIGCGNGTPTIQLARSVDCTILAVDNHQPFLDELSRRAAAAGVSDKITTLCADMKTLDIGPGVFDVIWAEGSLFVMGFCEGISALRARLAPGGIIAATDLAWFLPDPPKECKSFFDAAYADCPAAMSDVPAMLACAESCGYTIIEHFALPESSWTDSYYAPMDARLRMLREKYAADTERMGFIESVMQKEIDMYRKYSDYYGYEFFLMRR